ncbi:hypothetical protein [Marinobacter sp. F4216]|uniref:hypothetical protein n=1 Tax=Marinobacter sp. F4216 TaxID=2874281 RepID=UPI001CBA6BDD|nr:hypothetical protein [Marinobacter sp. F4216]MBZ2167695.1 hypothetical protein [Marinobacter sp. F4216]
MNTEKEKHNSEPLNPRKIEQINSLTLLKNLAFRFRYFVSTTYRKTLRIIFYERFSNHQICHFSFHKNLTVYHLKVAREFAHETARTQRHFNSFKEEFLASSALDIRSVNNHFIDIGRLREFNPDLRASLFVRDPRDLVVSGYHYHKRGAEWW